MKKKGVSGVMKKKTISKGKKDVYVLKVKGNTEDMEVTAKALIEK